LRKERLKKRGRVCNLENVIFDNLVGEKKGYLENIMQKVSDKKDLKKGEGG